jgi:hypothetical protein
VLFRSSVYTTSIEVDGGVHVHAKSEISNYGRDEFQLYSQELVLDVFFFFLNDTF